MEPIFFSAKRNVVFLVSCLALLFIAGIGGVEAATLDVNTTGYTDLGGFHPSATPIQSAIDAASPSDLINIHGGTYNENVNVSKALTLQGISAVTVVAVNASTPVIGITSPNVSVHDLIAQGGASGFGVYPGAENCTLVGNTAIGSGYGFRTLLALNTVMVGNTAINSTTTGFSVYSPLCTLVSNNATGCAYAYSVYMGNCTLVNNYALNNGDSFNVYLGGENCTLVGNTAIGGTYGFRTYLAANTTMTGNLAVNSTTTGFSIYSPLCHISANNATGCAYAFSVYVANTTLANNRALNNGDGFNVYLGAENCTLTGNTAIGGTYGFRTYLAARTTFVGNLAVNSTTTGFAVDSPSCTLESNNATGCAYAYSVYMGNCTLVNNYALNNGDSFNAYLGAENCTFSGNTAVGGTYGFRTYVAANTIFIGNLAVNSTTTGYSIYSPSCTVASNNATGCAYGYSVYVGNCTLTGNRADGCGSGFNVYLTSAALEGNTASGGGTGFHLYFAANSTLEGNLAEGCAGASYLVEFTMNGTFESNAAIGGATGFHMLLAINNTMVNSSAYNSSGYGIYLNQSFNNTITAGRISGNLMGGILSDNGTGNSFTWNDLINTINAFDNGTDSWDWNYYSDYVGFDRNGDMAGDAPHAISGGSNIDPHPRIMDLDAPVAIAISPLNGSMLDSVTVVSALYQDATSNVNASLCRLFVDGVEVTANASFATVSMSYPNAFADGTHGVSLYLEDYYGNAAWANWSFMVDSAPPVISGVQPANGSIGSDPSPWVNASYSDALSGLDIATVILRLDGADVTEIATVKDDMVFFMPSSPLSEGAHNASVSVHDMVGNLATAAWAFFVDTSAPEIETLAPANSSYASGTLTIQADVLDAVSGVASVVAEVDGALNVTLSLSGGHYEASHAFADGQHSFVVHAADGVGNVGSGHTIWFTVDTAPPQLSLLSPANASYPYSNIAINVSAFDALSDIASVVAEVDAANITLLLKEGFFAQNVVLSDGHHSVRIFAFDALGNANATLPLFFSVDTQSPSIVSISPVNGSYAASTITFNASVADAGVGVDTVLAEVDGAQYLVLSPASGFYSANLTLPDGHHSYRIIANDSLGNSLSTSAVFFLVDTTPPSVEIISPQETGYAYPGIAINVTALDALSGMAWVLAEVDGSFNVTLSLEEGQYVDTLQSFADGTHGVRVYACDSLGNIDASSSVAFTVDTTPPLVSVISPMNATYATSMMLINASVSDATVGVESVLAEVDGVNVTLVLTSGFYVGLSPYGDGYHTIRVFASDQLGNNASSSPIGFSVDTTPPTLGSFAPANGSLTSVNMPAISLAFSDTLSGVDAGKVVIRIDGGDVIFFVIIIVSSATYTPSAALANGQHTVEALVQDLVGNTATVAWSFTVDATPPVIYGLTPSQGSIVPSRLVQVGAGYSDAGSGVDAGSVRVFFDGADVTASATVGAGELSYFANGITDGQHSLTVVVEDMVGNSQTASWSFSVDATPPSLLSSYPDDGALLGTPSVEISFIFRDARSGVDLQTIVLEVDGGPVSHALSGGQQSGFTLVYGGIFGDGAHNASLSVADFAGNTIEFRLEFTVHSVPPAITVLAPADGSLLAVPQPEISAQFWDELGVDVSSVVVKIDGVAFTGAAVSASGFSASPTLADGLHTVWVYAEDMAGNPSTAEWSFETDTVAPQVVPSYPANGSSINATRPAISAAFSDPVSRVDRESVRVFMNGTDLTALATIGAEGFSYTPPQSLADGRLAISVFARDAVGNGGWVNWSFTVDTNPAMVSLVSVANNSVVPYGPLNLMFSLSDGQDEAPSLVRLVIDGVDRTGQATATPGGIRFNGFVGTGEHTVVITVVDDAGNLATLETKLTVADAPAPWPYTMLAVALAVAAAAVLAIVVAWKRGILRLR